MGDFWAQESGGAPATARFNVRPGTTATILAGEPVILDTSLQGTVMRPDDFSTITSGVTGFVGFALSTSNETTTATGTVVVVLPSSSQQFTGRAEGISLLDETQINTNVVIAYNTTVTSGFVVGQSTTTNGIFTIDEIDTATGLVTGRIKASEQVNA